MKSYKLIIALLTVTKLAFAQENTGNSDYNKWSFEVHVGQNKPVRPFADGYFSSDPTKPISFSGVNHFNLGVRYMLSNSFGFKLDYGRDKFINPSDVGSLFFDTQSNRLGLQGVMNLGRLLRFESFTKRFGLLAHAGIHMSQFKVNEGTNEDLTEVNAGVMFGMTPQIKINKWLALTVDFTVINNVRQHLNWDGSFAINDENLSGMMYNTSIGLTAYLGKKEKHADWYSKEDDLSKIKFIDQEARNRLSEIETMMNDSDRDGVLDYLDAENNTPTGVAVDAKGRFIDANNNGIPDEMEARQGAEKSSNSNNQKINKVLAAENDLVEKGLINIFFDVNSSIPNQGSSNNLYIILHYLQSTPEAKIKLYGFADKRGDEALNKNLSKERAQKVYNFFIANGIAPSRLSIEGVGTDTKFKDNSEVSLTLARRVSLEIIK